MINPPARLFLTLAGLALMAAPPPGHAAHPNTRTCGTEASPITLPAAPLPRTLQIFTALTACPILVDPSLIQTARSTPVSGRYTPDDALTHLLASLPLEATRTTGGFALQPTTLVP